MKQVVDNIQKRGAAAKIFIQSQHPMVRLILPVTRVALKQLRRGQAEAINALLHVADHEEIGLVAAAAQALEKGVLGSIDVLALVHQHVFEALSPSGRDGSPPFRAIAKRVARDRKSPPRRARVWPRKIPGQNPESTPAMFAWAGGPVPNLLAGDQPPCRQPGGQFRRFFEERFEQPAFVAGASDPEVAPTELPGEVEKAAASSNELASDSAANCQPNSGSCSSIRRRRRRSGFALRIL